MKKPNFFIIGAPKCGTTSLSMWLGEHPQIFVSPVKEPHFFNTDQNYRITQTISLYERLFLKANERHVAVGEASAWYLYSNAAVPNIMAYAPDARFIVCLRNPVDMAYSLHEQLVVAGFENIKSFDEAWKAQDRRAKGKGVSWLCSEPRFLIYKDTCALGDQVERLFQNVPRSRILPLLLDDVKANPQKEYSKVLQFLNVDDEIRGDFTVYNAAKESRSLLVRKVVLSVGRLKRHFGINRGFGILDSFDRLNLKYRQRVPMSPVLRRELQAYFAPDVEKLGRLLERDLSAWGKE